MARARNIKPGFFINEDLVELPFSTRLLFIGLWGIADREGRLKDRPKTIKMGVFPSDDVDVDRGLSELADRGLIIRYIAVNEQYIQIVNFTKHQNPHVNEAPSTIPAPELHDTSTVALTLNPESLLLNPEPIKTPQAANPVVAPSPAEKGDRPHPLPKDFKLTDELRDYAVEKIPNCDVTAIFDDFTDFWWNIATEHNKRTSRGWRSTWQRRIRTLADAERAKSSAPPKPQVTELNNFKNMPYPPVRDGGIVDDTVEAFS